jgi:hypothetical protein
VPIYFKCTEGSVTHYFHFLFGAFFPLLEYHIDHQKNNFRIMTDVGPFKSILCEMPFNIVEICGPLKVAQNAVQKAHDDKSVFNGMAVLDKASIQLKAYDTFNDRFYSSDRGWNKLSPQSFQRIISYLDNNVPRYIREIPTHDIILIERKEEAYYKDVKSDRTEIYSTSGRQRRSISNHADLAEALLEKFGAPKFVNLALERASLFYQYHIFSNAKVVVAQHGAALANIAFMRKKCHVIEIVPKQCEWNHFRNLADYCGAIYTKVSQETEFSAVDVAEIVRLVETSLRESERECAPRRSRTPVSERSSVPKDLADSVPQISQTPDDNEFRS